jgi:TRAP-type transport system small permease protein
MKPVLAAIDRVFEALVVVLFLAIVLVGSAQVFNRYFLNYSLSWSEEFQRYGQISMVFLAIPIAYRRGVHIGLELLHPYFSERGHRVFIFCIDLLWVALSAAIATGILQLMRVLQFQRSPGLGLPMHWVYGGMLLGAFYTILVGVRRLVANLRGRLSEEMPTDPSAELPVAE